ncbi:broad specificity phosphatase PhoE [Actinomadura pelletieri DSM 43383]|uniref:Broad specificity phosphatase PhoE n=1 Tax=Actinomadura pelletieri DSM 43383 TaxID=1120940 RepID=A0A495QBP2_9ACTN|nr:histidine phosphatase family protein [Actinomadura pelletieri]RKS69100.1 broad specificity phosphatase PhoE [Actinomadura pelletieri DSM 43383]
MAGVKALQWLILTRHGESTANLAYAAALGAGAEEIDVPERDPDVPLTDTGRAQAANLGRRLAALPEDERPTTVVTSPFVRALDTARIALAQTPYAAPQNPDGPRIRVDERLRDREQGVLSGLTELGVRRRFPEEADRLRRLGKFYHRPPGGESWADLALRLRSFYRDLENEAPGGRVLVVAHDVIVVMTRYLVEGLSEREIMEIDKARVANASLSRWRLDGSGPRAVCYNDSTHLNDADDSPAQAPH